MQGLFANKDTKLASSLSACGVGYRAAEGRRLVSASKFRPILSDHWNQLPQNPRRCLWVICRCSTADLWKWRNAVCEGTIREPRLPSGPSAWSDGDPPTNTRRPLALGDVKFLFTLGDLMVKLF